MGWVHAGFLAGLAALSVPLIIHLMSREKPRRLVFPTIRFIKKGQRVQQGKRGIKDLLVMLTRMALLAAVVLLLAHPYRTQEDAPTRIDAEQVLLFVDLSASMRSAEFATYMRDVRKTIQTTHPNATLGAIGSSGHIEFAYPVGSGEFNWESLAGLQPRPLIGNHAAALARVDSLFPADATNRHLYLLTDLQAVDWQPERLSSVPDSTQTHILPPEHSNQQNLAITRVEAESVNSAPGRLLRVSVQVRNFWIESADTILEVEIGSKRESRALSISAGGLATAELSLENPDGNHGIARLRTGGQLPDDDAYHFWAGPQPQLLAAVVGDMEDPAKAREAFFLQNALSASLPGMPAIKVTTRGTDIMWDTDINQFQGIFLLDAVADFSPDEAALLYEFCHQGGMLALFAGERSADCLSRFADAGFARAQFRGFFGGVGRFRSTMIDTADFSSPLLRAFEEDSADLKLFPIYQASRLAPGPDQTILCAAEDNMPIILHEQVGRGDAYYAAISLSAAWSDLPTAMCFLPLVRGMLEQSTAATDRRVLNRTLGHPLGLDLPEGMEPPALPSVFQIGDQPIQINITREESDLRAVPEGAVLRRLQDTVFRQNETAVQPEFSRQGSLQAILAWALLSALLLELLLANIRAIKE